MPPQETLAAEMLRFVGQGQRDVYNITAPFELDGLTLIAGREETREAPLKSRIGFYAENGGTWHKVSQLEHPKLELEDPFITFIDGRPILGAVQVDWRAEPLKFKTVFYGVDSLDDIYPIAEGPNRMKDIRLKQLDGDQILVLTRPDRSTAERIDRQIGWFKISDLGELTPERIEQDAIILEGMFAPGVWGGPNELHNIDDEWVGALSHQASRDDFGNLRYIATTFELNHLSGDFTPMEELLCRSDLPQGPSKTQQLQNVLFSGGLVRHGDGWATWYGGCSDATSGFRVIEDPFHRPAGAFFPTAA
jgi:hypothetical protein